MSSVDVAAGNISKFYNGTYSQVCSFKCSEWETLYRFIEPVWPPGMVVGCHAIKPVIENFLKSEQFHINTSRSIYILTKIAKITEKLTLERI